MTTRILANCCFFAGSVLTLALDLLTKRFFFATSHTFWFANGWIQSIDHRNFGIAFNLPVPQWAILFITGLACFGVLLFFLRQQRHQRTLFSLALGLLLGGALGNAIDRASFGFVRDWALLWFRSAINLADVGVLVGLFGALFTYKRVIP